PQGGAVPAVEHVVAPTPETRHRGGNVERTGEGNPRPAVRATGPGGPARRTGADARGGHGRVAVIAPSSCSRKRLRSSPPPYPPSAPPVRSTRWQGTTSGIGLVASALPAAREASGLPAWTARSR